MAGFRATAPWALVLILAVALWTTPAYPEQQLTNEVETCLSCHGMEGLSLTLASKEEMSLYIDKKEFARSVHGDKLTCTDCHGDVSAYPHPKRPFKTRREYTIALYESCKRCHFANYTKTLESVHYDLLSKGDSRAPVCVDCHGYHNVTRPDQPRTRVSKSCSKCHQPIYSTYLNSVHGKALVIEDNQDVPVCTDCHTAHTIADPRTTAFLVRTPELCGKCHADDRLMDKYGISTKVLKTYLSDFHGMTVSFYKKQQTQDISSFKAVCTDCHGVHDIARADDPNSSVMKANILATCKRCHPDATANFSSAWLSHYDPSPKKSALVYYVKLFYKIMIPLMVGGLFVQIFLHIWRVVVNR